MISHLIWWVGLLVGSGASWPHHQHLPPVLHHPSLLPVRGGFQPQPQPVRLPPVSPLRLGHNLKSSLLFCWFLVKSGRHPRRTVFSVLGLFGNKTRRKFFCSFMIRYFTILLIASDLWDKKIYFDVFYIFTQPLKYFCAFGGFCDKGFFQCFCWTWSSCASSNSLFVVDPCLNSLSTSLSPQKKEHQVVLKRC